jgi:hypothetical protein
MVARPERPERPLLPDLVKSAPAARRVTRAGPAPTAHLYP